VNATTRLGLLGLAVTLSACSVLESDKIDYKSATKGASLEVPPDLSQLSRDTRYTVPGGVVSAAAFEAGQAQQPRGAANAAPQAIGDVRIERDGNQRWLVVDRPADQLWEPVRDFWLENGFVYTLEQPNLGLLETDWAENRAKLPQDIIRSTIGKVFDSLYSTGERDKFRTRLERASDGRTEIYVSHRGMVEVYSTAQKDSTIWQPRPADPELETEFLRRLMRQRPPSCPRHPRPAWPRRAACRWCSSTRISTVHGAAWACRWTAPGSPWKTATAARACTSCAMSRPPRRRNRASSASSSAARRMRPRRSSTASWCAAKATRAPSRC
jgi:hypothetical protein